MMRHTLRTLHVVMLAVAVAVAVAIAVAAPCVREAYARRCTGNRYADKFGRCIACPPYSAVNASGFCACRPGYVVKDNRFCVRGAAAAQAPAVAWRTAWNTWYTSYPDPGSAECSEYNGCAWAGQFAYLPQKMSREWVAANNIVAMYDLSTKSAGAMAGKTVWLRKHGKTFKALVADTCADSDCPGAGGGPGCCTANATRGGGFLVDIEKNTCDRVFGTRTDAERNRMCGDGIVEWAPA